MIEGKFMRSLNSCTSSFFRKKHERLGEYEDHQRVGDEIHDSLMFFVLVWWAAGTTSLDENSFWVHERVQKLLTADLKFPWKRTVPQNLQI